MSNLWDDPTRDFRQRYQVPEHFIWDQYDLQAINYDGYVSIALSLLPSLPCSVIDVGCGDGWVARRIVERGYSVFGIDYSERAIGFARILVPTVHFEAGDIRTLADHTEWHNRFESAFHIEVIEHIPPEYHQSVLSGIRDCLVPGGTLIMTVPSINVPLNPWHYKHFSRDEGGDLLRQSGFEVQTVVNQQVLTPLNSSFFWRLLSNKIYDFRAARNVVGKILLKNYNTTDDPRRAGRYIYKAIKI